jgi:hypothetical protein
VIGLDIELRRPKNKTNPSPNCINIRARPSRWKTFRYRVALFLLNSMSVVIHMGNALLWVSKDPA